MYVDNTLILQTYTKIIKVNVKGQVFFSTLNFYLKHTFETT